jgi:hypothetical protein
MGSAARVMLASSCHLPDCPMWPPIDSPPRAAGRSTAVRVTVRPGASTASSTHRHRRPLPVPLGALTPQLQPRYGVLHAAPAAGYSDRNGPAAENSDPSSDLRTASPRRQLPGSDRTATRGGWRTTVSGVAPAPTVSSDCGRQPYGLCGYCGHKEYRRLRAASGAQPAKRAVVVECRHRRTPV